jgi:hypothetical protein
MMMTSFQVRQMQERVEQMDENIWFLLGRYQAKKESAEAIGDTQTAQVYGEIVELLEHVRDDESLKKICAKRGDSIGTT